jgi:hypothetical protein
MKILTLKNPDAHRATQLGLDDPRRLRAINRSWYTPYRGPVLIYAGEARCGWSIEASGNLPEVHYSQFVYGKIVGGLDLLAVIKLSDFPELYAMERLPAWAKEKYPWISEHVSQFGQYAEPFVWIFGGNYALQRPILWSGTRGLDDAPAAIVADVTQQRRELGQDAEFCPACGGAGFVVGPFGESTITCDHNHPGAKGAANHA